MTEQDDAKADLTDYEWELGDGGTVYAVWRDGHESFRSLVARFSDPYLANLAVAEQRFRLEESTRRPPTLAQEIAQVLNRHSMETASNTPDFLLAEYLERCLADAEKLINRRDEWYGVRLHPGHSYTQEPLIADPDDAWEDDYVADASILCGSCSYEGIRGDEKFCPQCGVEFVAPAKPSST